MHLNVKTDNPSKSSRKYDIDRVLIRGKSMPKYIKSDSKVIRKDVNIQSVLHPASNPPFTNLSVRKQYVNIPAYHKSKLLHLLPSQVQSCGFTYFVLLSIDIHRNNICLLTAT